MLEPSEPVKRLPDLADSVFWHYKAVSLQCQHGGPGSTIDFGRMSAFVTRLTLGVRMHPSAAFISMPNANGIITGGATARGFNDGTTRGYPLLLTLSTKQVSDIVEFDEEILRPKGGRLRPDDQMPTSEDSSDRLEAIRHVCAVYYLEGYLDLKVVDPIKDNFPSCTMPLSSSHHAQSGVC